MPTLESRVARLERENHLLRATLLLSAITLATCGGVTSHYELVTTNTLVIRDRQDQPTLALSSDGGGTLTFHGASTSTPVVLDAETIASLLAARAAAPSR